MRFAYNTNGTANHRLEDAIALIAGSGYDGIALTLDIHHLDPFADNFRSELRRISALLRAESLGCVIETGARFLLDPFQKHEPTLVTADEQGRAMRLDFLTTALEAAVETGADAMSFWAGVPKPGVTPDQAREWLLDGAGAIARRAEQLGTVAALEPEPGMAIELVSEWQALAIPGLRLALDTGHCLVTGEIDPAEAIRRYAADLGTVSIEDMARGVHVHLPFGEGDMDIPSVLTALSESGYDKLVCVELSRESHRADTMVPASLAWLRHHVSAAGR